MKLICVMLSSSDEMSAIQGRLNVASVRMATI